MLFKDFVRRYPKNILQRTFQKSYYIVYIYISIFYGFCPNSLSLFACKMLFSVTKYVYRRSLKQLSKLFSDFLHRFSSKTFLGVLARCLCYYYKVYISGARCFLGWIKSTILVKILVLGRISTKTEFYRKHLTLVYYYFLR